MIRHRHGRSPLTLTLSPEAGARGPEGSSSGFTLLEVVLSLALFFGALAALSQLTWNASRAALQSRLRTQAVILCETKLNEIVAGAEPLSSQSNMPYADDPNWSWSLSILPTQFPQLMLLEVTVSHTANNSLGNVSQTLRRWFRDPQVFIDAAIQQAEIDAANAASSSSSSSSSSSTGGTQ